MQSLNPVQLFCVFKNRLKALVSDPLLKNFDPATNFSASKDELVHVGFFVGLISSLVAVAVMSITGGLSSPMSAGALGFAAGLGAIGIFILAGFFGYCFVHILGSTKDHNHYMGVIVHEFPVNFGIWVTTRAVSLAALVAGIPVLGFISTPLFLLMSYRSLVLSGVPRDRAKDVTMVFGLILAVGALLGLLAVVATSGFVPGSELPYVVR